MGNMPDLLVVVVDLGHGQELHRLALEEDHAGWVMVVVVVVVSSSGCGRGVGERERERRFGARETPKYAARLISQPCRP
jgi:hypothetical protein